MEKSSIQGDGIYYLNVGDPLKIGVSIGSLVMLRDGKWYGFEHKLLSAAEAEDIRKMMANPNVKVKKIDPPK